MDLEVAAANQGTTATVPVPGAETGCSFRHYLAGRWSVIESVGEIDCAVTEAMRTTLDEASSPDVIFDLRRVAFIDASGLAVLAAAYRRGLLNNGSVRLVSPVRTVRRVLEVTHLDRVMATYDGLDEALR